MAARPSAWVREKERKIKSKGRRRTGQEKKEVKSEEWDVWKINFNYVRNSTASPQLFNNQNIFAHKSRSFNSFSQTFFLHIIQFTIANICRHFEWCLFFHRERLLYWISVWPMIELRSTGDLTDAATSVRNFTPQQIRKEKKRKTKYVNQPNGWPAHITFPTETCCESDFLFEVAPNTKRDTVHFGWPIFRDRWKCWIRNDDKQLFFNADWHTLVYLSTINASHAVYL